MALYKNGRYDFFIGVVIITILFIPLVASQNIDCSGKAFHCVNSTHFKICVDLGGGVSTTVDDYLISCPKNTVCKDNNYFECEYQATTTLTPIVQSDVTNYETSVTSTWENLDTPTLFTSRNVELSRVIDTTFVSKTNTPVPTTESTNIRVHTVKDLSNLTYSNISGSEKYNSLQTKAFETVTGGEGFQPPTTPFQKLIFNDAVLNFTVPINELNDFSPSIKTYDSETGSVLNTFFTEKYTTSGIENNSTVIADITSTVLDQMHQDKANIYFNDSSSIYNGNNKSGHSLNESTTESIRGSLVNISVQNNITNDMNALTTVIYDNELFFVDDLNNLNNTTLQFSTERISTTQVEGEKALTQDNLNFVNVSIALEKVSNNLVASSSFQNVSDTLLTTETIPGEYISTGFIKFNNLEISSVHDLKNNSNNNFQNNLRVEQNTTDSAIHHLVNDIDNLINDTVAESVIDEHLIVDNFTQVYNTTIPTYDTFQYNITVANISLTVSTNLSTTVGGSYIQNSINEAITLTTPTLFDYSHTEPLQTEILNYTSNLFKYSDTVDVLVDNQSNIPVDVNSTQTFQYDDLQTSQSPKESPINQTISYIPHRNKVEDELTSTTNYVFETNFSDTLRLNIQSTHDYNLSTISTNSHKYDYNASNVSIDLINSAKVKPLINETFSTSSPFFSTINVMEVIQPTGYVIIDQEKTTISDDTLHRLGSEKMSDAVLNEVNLPSINTVNRTTDNRSINNNKFVKTVILSKEDNLINNTPVSFSIKNEIININNKEVKNNTLPNFSHLQKSIYDTTTEPIITIPNNLTIHLDGNSSSVASVTVKSPLDVILHKIDFSNINYKYDLMNTTDVGYNTSRTETTTVTNVPVVLKNYDSFNITLQNETYDQEFHIVKESANLSKKSITDSNKNHSEIVMINRLLFFNVNSTPKNDFFNINNKSDLLARDENVSLNGTVSEDNSSKSEPGKSETIEYNIDAQKFGTIIKGQPRFVLETATAVLNTYNLSNENYLENKNNITNYDIPAITETGRPISNQHDSRDKLNTQKNYEEIDFNNVLNITNQSQIQNNSEGVGATKFINRTNNDLGISHNISIIQPITNKTSTFQVPPDKKNYAFTSNSVDITKVGHISTQVEATPFYLEGYIENITTTLLNTQNNSTNSSHHSENVFKNHSNVSHESGIELKNAKTIQYSVGSFIRDNIISSTSSKPISVQGISTESRDFLVENSSGKSNLSSNRESIQKHLSPTRCNDSLATLKYDAISKSTVLQDDVLSEFKENNKNKYVLATVFEKNDTHISNPQNIKVDNTIINEFIESDVNKQRNQISYNKNTIITSTVRSILSKLHNGYNKVVQLPTAQFTCTKRGKYSDKNDCNKFYICIGKFEPILGICPKNTVFSEIRKQCTNNLSHCVRNSQFKCLAAGRFIDVLTHKFYYICVKKTDGYVRFKFKCQKGYHLNTENVQCIHDSVYSSEDGSKNTSEKNTYEKSNEYTQIYKKNFVCEEEGKFVYPENCRKYYVCTKNSKSQFRRKLKKCDSDEVFDKEKKLCVEDDSYEC